MPTARLTQVTTHTDPTIHPGDLMNPELPPCSRRDDKGLTRDILNHGVWDPLKPTPGTAILFGCAAVVGLRRRRAA